MIETNDEGVFAQRFEAQLEEFTDFLAGMHWLSRSKYKDENKHNFTNGLATGSVAGASVVAASCLGVVHWYPETLLEHFASCAESSAPIVRASVPCNFVSLLWVDALGHRVA